jgi:outer membrane protein assembly factor BamE
MDAGFNMFSLSPLMIRSALLFSVVLLTACTTSPEDRSWITYRIDVRQGNLVTPEMAAQLKVGQSKDQVRFLLGTPMLADMFHADRWDYIYRFQPGRIGSESVRQRLVVFFEDGKLAKFEGDIIPLDGKFDLPPKPATQVIDIDATDGSKNSVNP